MFTRSLLVSLKRRALRKKAWLRVLKGTERALVNASIAGFEVIRSEKVTDMLASISRKIAEATEGILKKARRIGRLPALKASMKALAWGNLKAARWIEDESFAEYLGLQILTDPSSCKSAGTAKSW